MKRVAIFATIFCLILFISSFDFVFAYKSPGKPGGYVNDFANVINQINRNKLEQELSVLDKSTTIQVSIVTVPSLDNDSIENYAVKLFEEWKIGQKNKNNGVLFLIAPNDRKVRIEVGYGLEAVLTDAQSNYILQNIVLPKFKKNDIEDGIINGTEEIIKVVKGEQEIVYNSNDNIDQVDTSFYKIFIVLAYFGVTIFGNIMARTRSWWFGGILGAIAGLIIGFVYGFIFTGLIFIIILSILGLIIDYFLSKSNIKNMPWFMGGGRGGSGGGFGGFGGGRSGGGGASGSW